jgi:hypothetical protein
MATAQDQAQSVRFSDVHEEIEPQAAVDHVTALTGAGEKREEPLSPEAEQELRNLSKSLQQSRCQARRMANFAYEPVSLPPSRVCMSVPYLVTVWLIRKKGTITLACVTHTLRPLRSLECIWSSPISSCVCDAFTTANPSRHFFSRWEACRCGRA